MPRSNTLIEQGDELSAELGSDREDSVRWAETDKDGRYSIRVGPGRYSLSGPRRTDSAEEVVLKAGATLERDFHIDRLERDVLKGIVLADAFDGKPVAGAVLVGQGTQFRFGDAVADEQGRFELGWLREESFLYARNPEGTLATILPIAADADEVKIVIGSAGKLRGRLIDKAGKPRVGVRILCGLRIGPEDKPNARAALYTQTDEAGRFALVGIVPGAECQVHAFTGEGAQTLRTLPQTQAEAVDLGDLMFDPGD